MLLPFALLADILPQTNSGAVHPAITCAAAARSVDTAVTVRNAVPAIYLAMTAGRDDTGTAPFLERYVAASKAVPAEIQRIKGTAPALLAGCRQRYPKAWASAAVTLPADSFDRRLMCMGIAGSYVGVVRTAAKAGDQSVSLPEVEAVSERFGDLIGDGEFRAKGMDDVDKVKQAMSEQLIAALRLGNVQVTYDACLKAFPG